VDIEEICEEFGAKPKRKSLSFKNKEVGDTGFEPMKLPCEENCLRM
jgi:hypothetical protein